MVATAQAGDWEGRVEQLRTHQENGRQYCARHAAMLKKENERARKDNHEQILERKELLSTSPKVSILHPGCLYLGASPQQFLFTARKGK